MKWLYRFWILWYDVNRNFFWKGSAYEKIKTDYNSAIFADYHADTDSCFYPAPEKTKCWTNANFFGDFWHSSWPKFYNSTGEKLIYYTENNKIVSKFGIDVSEHDGQIDWQTVKNAGVEFVFLRVGYRGYSGGQIVSDKYYTKNLQGAQEAGIDIGLYFYSQAITPEEALEEAEVVLSAVGDAKITYPIVYDWEFVTTDTARTDDISAKTLTECSIAFCERIKQAGYLPMIYQNKNTSLLNLNLPELTDYDFWLAEYTDTPTYYYNYQIWQYSAAGTIPGISGEVDMNICFKDYTNSIKKESDENA